MNFTTYIDAIAQRAAEDSGKGITFVESADKHSQISYSELFVLAKKTLASFNQKGIRQGDHLVLFLNDNAKFVQAFWACLLGGIVPVPVAVGISEEHRSKLLKILSCFDNAWLWSDEKSTSLLWRYIDENNLGEKYKFLREQTLITDEFVLSDTEAEPANVNENDTGFIQFSSGSTRDPKGVVLTHKNLLTTNIDIGNRLAFTPEDTSLSWMPLTHDLGLIGFHLNMLVFGMNQVLMPTDLFSRRPIAWLQKASEFKASILTSPNFGFKHALKLYDHKENALEGADLSAVRVIVNGAEPISIPLCDEFLEKMSTYGMPKSAIIPAYGLAEASLYVSASAPGEVFSSIHVNRDKLVIGDTVTVCDEANDSTVSFAVEGYPVERCEVLIADLDGENLGKNKIGEVLIKGPNVTGGYYNEPAENEKLFAKNGFLKTGDLGFLHEGRVVITGRLKDIIIVAGQNYYPHDIETMVLELPEMELGKVVVCGARQNNASEDDILVCILDRGDIDNFKETAQTVKSHINQFSGIDVTHVLPVPRIPKTTSGKIQRRFFAEQYLAGEFNDVISKLGFNVDSSYEVEVKSNIYQEFIANSCQNTLDGKSLGLDDNFFDVGVTSLEMAQIHESIEDKYPGSVDIMDIFDHPSIKELATFLESKVS